MLWMISVQSSVKEAEQKADSDLVGIVVIQERRGKEQSQVRDCSYAPACIFEIRVELWKISSSHLSECQEQTADIDHWITTAIVESL